MLDQSWQPETMMGEIQAKRQLMIESANLSGFTSENTIRYSQELDELIVAYQKVRNRMQNPGQIFGDITGSWNQEIGFVLSARLTKQNEL
ncbi:aspartyl-phosphate phosphatase Spo0E family protein [Bacillus sp. FJAT-18017]|uniref:aspartyl-phosphate phosphatase Spo0E family protein n=1 Tax=Bacillus sp. FJAT-18017 TaxID=1705566 RepID=UPI0006ADF775|nr:aspartyl-phosphate phosphatase Spo0E family protein [Bacillus sp. FJAT-18017]